MVPDPGRDDSNLGLNTEASTREVSVRKLIGGLLALLAVAVLFVVGNAAEQKPSVSRANFDKIKVGMPFARTKAILGKPYHTAVSGPDDLITVEGIEVQKVCRWSADNTEQRLIEIGFSYDQEVVAVRQTGLEKESPALDWLPFGSSGSQ